MINGADRFRVGMGAEAVKELLEAIDMEKESEELKKGLKECHRSEECKNHQTSGGCRGIPRVRKQTGVDGHDRDPGDPA